jgi:hypothetical protein
MKNAKNMRFVIMNRKGFVSDTDTGKVTMHPTAQAAMKFMKPGDQIIPIKDETELDDYQSGKVRMPVLNRSGLR